MSIADDIMDAARAGNDVFTAGMKAAEDNSPSARNLARLLPAAEKLLAIMDRGDGDPMGGDVSVSAIRKFGKLVRACDELRAAVAEARKP